MHSMRDDMAPGDWLGLAVERLMGRGLAGAELDAELSKMVWVHLRERLAGAIGHARAMREAWHITAECLEKELAVLMAAVPEMSACPNQ
jgi:hypothetical protein